MKRNHSLGSLGTLLLALSTCPPPVWAADLSAAAAQAQPPAAGVAPAATPAPDAPQPAALDQAFGTLRNFDSKEADGAMNVIDLAIARAGQNPAPRIDLEQRFIAALQAGVSKPAQKFICAQLSRIASDRSVPAMAPLLDDPELAYSARYVLERTPGSAAGQLLSQKLGTTTAGAKAGIINSLGNLRVSEATEKLAALLQDPDPVIAGAAAMALGNIGSADAAKALNQFQPAAASPLSLRVEDARLRAAERLAASGDTAGAGRIYEDLFRQAKRPHVRVAGLKGQLSLEPDKIMPRLLDTLRSPEGEDQAVIALMVAELPAHQDFTAIIEVLPKLSPDLQIVLIKALADRKAIAAKPAIIGLAQSSPELKVRQAAFEALIALGDASDIRFLAQAAATGDEQNRLAARVSLFKLGSQDLNSAMVAVLAESGPEVRVELIQALVARNAKLVTTDLRGYLGDRELPVRAAAVKALGALGNEQDLPALITRLKSSGTEAEMAGVKRALYAIVRRKPQPCLPLILPAIPDAKGYPRVTLLGMLSLFGGAEALNVVRNELKSNDPQVSAEALRTLAAWPELEALQDLLQIVKSKTTVERRIEAFDGYIRLVRTTSLTDADKTEALAAAMSAVPRMEDERLVLAALGETKGLAALKLAQPCLRDSNLVEEAAIAVVNIASTLGDEHRTTAVTALKQVLQVSQNPEVRQRAQEALKKTATPVPATAKQS